MGVFGGTSRAATLNIWRDMQVVVCLSAQITSGTPLVWRFIEYQRRDVSSSVFGSTAKKPSLKLFHDAFFSVFSRGKIVPVTSSSFSFTFSCFIFSIPPSVLLFWAVLTLLKRSTSLSAMFVYIRVPPDNPINARAPSLGPRLSLFSEVGCCLLFAWANRSIHGLGKR